MCGRSGGGAAALIPYVSPTTLLPPSPPPPFSPVSLTFPKHPAPAPSNCPVPHLPLPTSLPTTLLLSTPSPLWPCPAYPHHPPHSHPLVPHIPPTVPTTPDHPVPVCLLLATLPLISPLPCPISPHHPTECLPPTLPSLSPLPTTRARFPKISRLPCIYHHHPFSDLSLLMSSPPFPTSLPLAALSPPAPLPSPKPRGSVSHCSGVVAELCLSQMWLQ